MLAGTTTPARRISRLEKGTTSGTPVPSYRTTNELGADSKTDTIGFESSVLAPRREGYGYRPESTFTGHGLLNQSDNKIGKRSRPPPYRSCCSRRSERVFRHSTERNEVTRPTGDWLGRGAWALENPRTATGEHSLEKLHTLLSDLESRGVNSESFSQLKGKVPLRRGWDEHSTT